MPGDEAQQTNRPITTRSTNSKGVQRQETTISKRRQPKSRTGCNTCKARRMKCDELKPSCSQCIDRGVECGGYVRNLKWKLVGEQSKKRGKLGEIQPQASGTMSTGQTLRPSNKDTTPDDQITTSPFQAETSLSDGITRVSNARALQAHEESLWQSLPHDQLFDFDDVDFSVDFFLGDDTINLSVPTDLSSHANTPSRQLLERIDSHVPSSTDATDNDPRKEKAPDLSDLIFSPRYPPQDFQELENHVGGVPHSSRRLQSATLPVYGLVGQHHHNPENDDVLRNRHLSFSDTPQAVKQLFDKHLCNVLSIKDDPTTNPWAIHVWPLAGRCPALYHALAAMTYLYLGNAHPEFNAAGSKNFHASLQAFEQGEDNTNAAVEAFLAGRLALGFAEAWDDQSASTGIEHIKIAGRLLRDALNKHQTTRQVGDNLDRLIFLARTWMYKDVMLRFTASDYGESAEIDLMTAYIRLDPLPVEQQLDPLLGCAITLFPLIAGLTDIIRSVRRRTEKHNSPSTISKGAELWTAIEDWSPSFDPQRSANVPSHISDIIQTAEAYRWAALLLLRHAVPELPWALSFWELAEKVLIYLATTPVTSRAMIIQTFPLMAIGGEAFDEEDRNWICQRWDAMAKRVPLSRLDKCKQVTKEVWRRKDEFEAQRGACPSCGAYRPRSTGISSPLDTLPVTDVSAASSKDSEVGSRRCQCSAVKSITAPASNFPDSLAFRKGIDNITRAGNLHYTVRGELHWLKVMENWKWEVVLG
ncbi:hypothetical protein, variant [Cladophialophora immunda]|uniref:Zn(2)-C6 fungal-type domain-containing protein n=1 Tax=Cladophialophora immunda TaxID=569365 RepID=A0A0D2CFS4_9EURO|nr:uncharacterized protein PV07_04887 [Cladophialophora immunda]XP_016249257.1 hypothetical protein, variant [Cladophialophora immunda]KIW29040.1 hypothetical protein PV07_04887 [Cladophialophora immunda]KIW29041.1 hypothetical protein, variant [Cladophialophora immunda]